MDERMSVKILTVTCVLTLTEVRGIGSVMFGSFWSVAHDARVLGSFVLVESLGALSASYLLVVCIAGPDSGVYKRASGAVPYKHKQCQRQALFILSNCFNANVKLLLVQRVPIRVHYSVALTLWSSMVRLMLTWVLYIYETGVTRW